MVCTSGHSKRIFDKLGFQVSDDMMRQFRAYLQIVRTIYPPLSKVTGEVVWSETEVEGKVYFDKVEESSMTVHYKKME